MYLEFTAFVMNDLLPFRYTLPSRRWYVLASDELSEPGARLGEAQHETGLAYHDLGEALLLLFGVPYSVMSLSAHRLPYT